LEVEKADRQKKRLEELAVRRAKEEAEKEFQFQQEQEVPYIETTTINHLCISLTFFCYRNKGDSKMRKSRRTAEGCKRLLKRRPGKKRTRSANSSKNRR